MKKDNVVIRLRNINKTYSIREQNRSSIQEHVLNIFRRTKRRDIYALKNINLDVKAGEFLGIVGRNGSGKSTLLRIILGAYPPDKGGTVEVQGKVIRLALGMGFNPQLSARQNIYVNASILGLTFKQIGRKFDEIVEFAGLKDFIDTDVNYFSSGMRSRLAFSVAKHAEADIFLMDEFFVGVGDVDFRQKAEKVFKESIVKGKTIIHVSHNLDTIEEHCDRVVLLHDGKIVQIGKPLEVLETYRALFKKKQ